MLSYQHAYHAGNRADLHKHALLATALAHLTRKPKPLRYLETHAGRGLYDLTAPEAQRTGEAAAGIARAEAEGWLSPDHPLAAALARVRTAHGPAAYPGSPLVARHLLRPGDAMDLAELHPSEHAALAAAVPTARLHARDGFAMARALIPPTPRRGLLLIDPSYEQRGEYDTVAAQVAGIAQRWPVGVVLVWFPILADDRHAPMLAALRAAHEGALVSLARFAPARPGHGMIGSGIVVLNPPFGLETEARRLEALPP